MERTRTFASSKWTSIRRRTIRVTCPARPAGTGRPSCATRSSRDIVPIKKLEELLGKTRHRQQDDDHPVRRQQQLVRRLGVLAAEDLRPRGRAHHGRRPQEVAGRGTRAQHRQADRRGEDVQGERRRTSRCARSCRRCSRRRRRRSASLVDVRSPQEFTGEILAPPGLPETCQRGGHIPGAKSIPWGKNVQRRRHVQERGRAEGAVRRARA